MINQKRAKSRDCATSLGYKYFILAFIFLANPCINVVDILPDFFGYVFLIQGLSKWADLCPNVSDAVDGLGRLRWFMLLKMFSMALVPFVDSIYVLIFVFSFGIIELMYALPAFARIFNGLEYFGTHFDSDAIFVKYRDIRLLTNVFFVVKTAFCIFPELCSLASSNYYGVITSAPKTDHAVYRNLLVIINLLLILILGALWVISLAKYTRRIAKDTPFLERVLDAYENKIGSNTGLTIRRRFRLCASLIIAGLVFIPNMWLDGINFVPTFVCGIFIAASMLLLSRISKISKWSVLLPIVFAIVSAISFGASIYFGAYFRVADVYQRSDTFIAFTATRILAAAEYVAMIATACAVYHELKKIVAVHLAASSRITDSRIIAFHKDTQRQFNRSLTVGLIAFIIAALINLAYLILRADIITDLWLVAFLVMIICILYMASVINRLHDQIDYKYL